MRLPRSLTGPRNKVIITSMGWNLGSCKERSSKLEWIDMPDLSDQELSRVYAFIESVNHKFNSHKIVLDFLKRCSKRWHPHQTLSILDINCGRGDLSCEIVKWARRRGQDIRILAVDRYGRIVQLAKETHTNYPEITFDLREMSDPLFLQAQQFDYVVSHLTLHHFEDPQIISFIKIIDRLAKRGLILTDWRRDVRAKLLMASFASFLGEKVIQNDGPLAIQKGFTLNEVRGFLKQAGLSFTRVAPHYGFRFSFSGERAYIINKELRSVRGFVGT